jgi:hypothetical protein
VLGDDLGEPFMEGPIAGGQVEHVGRAGVRRAHEDEDSPTGARGAGEQRLERVGPEQRVRGGGVGAERPEDRLRVDGGRVRNVTALAVGDNEQARRLRGVTDLCERRRSWRAQRVEAGELWLDRDAGVTGSLDQADTCRSRSRGGRRGRVAFGPRTRRCRAPGLGIEARVEPDADLAAALLDERREPVCERVLALGGRVSRP